MKCRGLLLALGMLFVLSACGQSEQLPTVEERLLAIYNGEVSVEEAEARGWLDKEFNETEVYKIVGSQEADPMNGVISEDSPFGRALLGKNVGDDVVVDAPAGSVEYKLLKVER